MILDWEHKLSNLGTKIIKSRVRSIKLSPQFFFLTATPDNTLSIVKNVFENLLTLLL